MEESRKKLSGSKLRLDCWSKMQGMLLWANAKPQAISRFRIRYRYHMTSASIIARVIIARPFPISLGNLWGFEQLFENRATCQPLVTFELLLPFELGVGPHSTS